MIKYGINEFKNPNDASVSVSINDGILKEVGVPTGSISDGYEFVQAHDVLGNKIKTKSTNLIIDAISEMSNDQISMIRNKLFGDVVLKPSTITGITPFVVNENVKGQDHEFIIYGKNLNVNDTETTKLVLVDEVTTETIEAKTWTPINSHSIHAVFKIPVKSTATKFKPAFVFGNEILVSSSEMLVLPELSFEKIVLNFKTFAENSEDYETNESNISFSPHYSEQVGTDSITTMSGKIDGSKDFVIDIDLSLNTQVGANMNVYDLTRTGIGIGMFDNKNGSSWIDYVNLDVSDFKPRFGTYFIKDNIRHIKFVKVGKTITKIVYTEESVYTTKMIITPVEDFRLIAKCQRLDATGTIKEVKFTNISVNYFKTT